MHLRVCVCFCLFGVLFMLLCFVDVLYIVVVCVCCSALWCVVCDVAFGVVCCVVL